MSVINDACMCALDLYNIIFLLEYSSVGYIVEYSDVNSE